MTATTSGIDLAKSELKVQGVDARGNAVVRKQLKRDQVMWVAAWLYLVLNFIDSYSRYSVHHKLLITLDGQSVATKLQAALDAA